MVMGDKIDNKSWSGDFPNRENAPFTVKNGGELAKVILIAMLAVLVVGGLLIVGGAI